jgi:hypothetical protein
LFCKFKGKLKIFDGDSLDVFGCHGNLLLHFKLILYLKYYNKFYNKGVSGILGGIAIGFYLN